MPEITKTEITQHSITMELSNGTIVRIDPNDNYIHLSFSFIKDGVSATSFANNPHFSKMNFANYLDIEYKPSKS